MAFVPSDAEARQRAVGSLSGLSPVVRRALTAGDDFAPVPSPARLDWLAVKREPGQTFERFMRTSSTRPTPARPHFYLQPLGDLSPEAVALVNQLRRFASAFSVREMHVLPVLSLEGRGITGRRNRYTDVAQLKTRDLLALLARELPADACFVLGVTTTDLYPHETWSFVFGGEALLDDRVGVFSVARYDPRFYDRPADDGALLLRRSCKVLAHDPSRRLSSRPEREASPRGDHTCRCGLPSSSTKKPRIAPLALSGTPMSRNVILATRGARRCVTISRRAQMYRGRCFDSCSILAVRGDRQSANRKELPPSPGFFLLHN